MTNRLGSLISTADLAQIGAMWNRSADGVDGLIADNDIQIGAVCAEGVIAGCAHVRAGLPPAMLPADDIWRQRVVKPGARPHAAFGRVDAHPIAGGDVPLGSGCWVQFDLRVEGKSPQTRQRTMLALAKERVLGASQDQGVALGQLRSREGTDQRLFKLRKRWVAMRQHRLGVQLDLARRRGKAVSDTVVRLGVLAVAGLEREAHPAWVRS